MYNLHYGHFMFSESINVRVFNLELSFTTVHQFCRHRSKVDSCPVSVAACTEKMFHGYGRTCKALLNVMSINCPFLFFRVMLASPLIYSGSVGQFHKMFVAIKCIIKSQKKTYLCQQISGP